MRYTIDRKDGKKPLIWHTTDRYSLERDGFECIYYHSKPGGVTVEYRLRGKPEIKRLPVAKLPG